MQSARSTPSAAATASSTEVSGLKATPTPRPSARAAAMARSGASHASTWKVTLSPPAFAIASKCFSGSATMRWQSSAAPQPRASGAIDARTIGPTVISGMKWPSPTSKWRTRTPAPASAAIWSPSRAKSDAYSDGSTSTSRAASQIIGDHAKRTLTPAVELRADVATGVEREKQLAAQAAAGLAESGMTLGLGTGSTATFFVEALAARRLELRCVATSLATEQLARSLGLEVVRFEGTDAPARLDLAVDGADQVAEDGWIVKGGGGAHTREKLVAAAADRFVVIVSSDKLVERVTAPIPLELLSFGLGATLARLGTAELRGAPPTPDGGVLAAWTGPGDEPFALAQHLAGTPGVVDHGLFPPELVSEVIIGRGNAVERL